MEAYQNFPGEISYERFLGENKIIWCPLTGVPLRAFGLAGDFVFLPCLHGSFTVPLLDLLL